MSASSMQVDGYICQRALVAEENLRRLQNVPRPFAVIIKPTDSCNMACSYCYVNHKSKKPWMEDDVLEASIAKMSDLIKGKRLIHFIWHGGEPLMNGLEFFEKVVDLQNKYCRDIRFENCIQTNGTLLTEELVRFFIENSFSISLSIDGPASLHNINRKFVDGRGSFASVMEAVRLIRSHGQLVGAVAVMTKDTLPRISELYNFMKKMGIQFRINPIIGSESNAHGFNEKGITPLEYSKAMQELFDLWFSDDTPIHIDPINLIVGNMISDTVWGCDYLGGCLQDVICINPDGNLYPCGQLAGNDLFYMGNILEKSITDILSSPVYIHVRGRSPRLIRECNACEYVNICNSGCIVSACMRDKGILAPDYFCEGRKLLFAHIRDSIKDEVDKIHRSITCTK